MSTAPALSWEKQTLKLRNPFRLSYGATEERQSFWLRLRNDEGWGEASIPPYYRVDASEMIACWERANSSGKPLPDTRDQIPAWVPDGPAPARCAIELALFDRIAKRRGVPLYQLLGGKVRDKVPVYATALYPEEPSKVARRAREFAEKGFHGVKIKVGFDLEQDIRIVRAVRQELGKDFVVMTDANQGYSIDVGITAAQAFADAGAFWLEEPLFVEDIAGHAMLRERGNTPIAVGENLHMTYAFENFILRGAVDFIQPDVARAGGITEIRKITALAAKHQVPVSFHTWGDGVALAASVHLSAALQDCIVMELDYTYNPLREELLVEPFQVQNGYLAPSDKPGLGIELNPAAIERFAFAGSEDLAIRQKTLH